MTLMTNLIETENPTLVKIAALLRQAEKAGTPAEAEAFSQKAQAMASRYSIDLSIARNFVPLHERKESPTSRDIRLSERPAFGKRGKQNKDQLVMLFSTIAGMNDVKIDIFADSSGVIAFGFPSDIDLVEMMYASLVIQMTDQANAYLARGEYKTETVWREKRVKDEWGYTETTYGVYPIDGRQARRSFNDGFRSSIAARLREGRSSAIRETEEAQILEAKAMGIEVNPFKDPTSDWYAPDSDEAKEWDEMTAQPSSVALVLVKKSEEVRDYHRSTSQARGSWKGSSASGVHSSGSYGAGRTAGQNARLGAPRGISGSRGSLAR